MSYLPDVYAQDGQISAYDGRESYPSATSYDRESYPQDDYRLSRSHSSRSQTRPGAKDSPAVGNAQGQTVVILTSPNTNHGTRDWTYGMCGCFNNCGICILSWFCPCYLVGKNAEYLGESFFVYALASLFIPFFIQFVVRLKIRERLSIRGSELEDCCYVWWLAPCSLTQEHLELLEAPHLGQVTGVTIQRQ